jgi:D-alanyl-D-alanine dipeptidase
MWKIVSNPEYVANPAKGSVHNRGGAVDITLVDATGKELNMGTSFDFLESKRVITIPMYLWK